MTRKKQPDILVPDKRIVSAEEVERKRRRAPGTDDDWVTREELLRMFDEKVLAGVGAGINAAADNMYEQMSGEIADNLEKMTDVITQNVLAIVERRTMMGRFRQWVRKLRRPKNAPAFALARNPDIFDAMDPNVRALEEPPNEDPR